MIAQKCMQCNGCQEKMENVKKDAICHVTRQNQYNPAGGGATTISTTVNIRIHQEAIYTQTLDLLIPYCKTVNNS